MATTCRLSFMAVFESSGWLYSEAPEKLGLCLPVEDGVFSRGSIRKAEWAASKQPI